MSCLELEVKRLIAAHIAAVPLLAVHENVHEHLSFWGVSEVRSSTYSSTLNRNVSPKSLGSPGRMEVSESRPDVKVP